MNGDDEGREEKQERVTLKQYVFESDPEVQEWLKTVSEIDYDFVSRYEKEMRYDGGTRAKMLLHRALKVYCDEQLAKERKRIFYLEELRDSLKSEFAKELREERELRKELVEWGEVLLRNTRFVGIFPDSSIKLEALIKKGT